MGSDFGFECEQDECEIPEETSVEQLDEADNTSDSEVDMTLIHFQKLQWKHEIFRNKDLLKNKFSIECKNFTQIICVIFR